MLRSIFCILFLISLASPSWAGTNENNGPVVTLITPLEGGVVIERKPRIQFVFPEQVQGESLLVLLDGMDITGISDIGPAGLVCQLLDVLAPGEHVLNVYGQLDNQQFEQEFIFSSRHFAMVEEVTSNNELSGEYSLVTSKAESLDGVPHNRIDVFYNSETYARENGWEVNLTANMLFMDQNIPAIEPEEKGIDLIDYLLQAGYTGENISFLSELGDIQVDQSRNTVEYLARRGAQATFTYNDISVGAFSVQSSESFGASGSDYSSLDSLDDGEEDSGSLPDNTFLGFNSDNTIWGISGGVDLFADRINLKTFYITGVELATSFGSWSQEGDKEGEVAGFLLTTNFFEERFKTELEYDISDMDPDTSDKFESEKDYAFRLQAEGFTELLSYAVAYEYFGPNYEVPGNAGIQKDSEGISANSSLQLESSLFDVSLGLFRDNVDLDSLYARTHSLSGSTGYTYSGLESIALNLNYSKSVDRSSDEPEDYFATSVHTDIVGGSVGFVSQIVSVDAQAEYSLQNDRTIDDLDFVSTLFSLSASYVLETFSLFSSVSMNQAWDEQTNIRADTYTATLDLQGSFLIGAITYALGGSYDRSYSTDDLTDQNSVGGYCRTAYYFQDGFMKTMNTSLGLEMTYNKRDDQINEDKEETNIILLKLSSVFPHSF